MSESEPSPEEQADGQGSEPGVRAEQTQEPTSSYADIVLFCHPRNVSNLVRTLEDEIEHAAGELPLFVLWSGVSGVLHQGVIVLEWEGMPSKAFLHSLSIDHEIFDYVVYTWIKGDDASQSANDHMAQADQHGEDGQIERGGLYNESKGLEEEEGNP